MLFFYLQPVNESEIQKRHRKFTRTTQISHKLRKYNTKQKKWKKVYNEQLRRNVLLFSNCYICYTDVVNHLALFKTEKKLLPHSKLQPKTNSKAPYPKSKAKIKTKSKKSSNNNDNNKIESCSRYVLLLAAPILEYASNVTSRETHTRRASPTHTRRRQVDSRWVWAPVLTECVTRTTVNERVRTPPNTKSHWRRVRWVWGGRPQPPYKSSFAHSFTRERARVREM